MYHRQTSSSSFLVRFPVAVPFVGEELTIGFESFFGVTFSCLTLAIDFFVDADDGDLDVDGFSFLTAVGVVEVIAFFAM